MSQDGYTLAETLAALMIIGLAIGGLTEGMRTLGMVQASAGRAMAGGRALRGAHQALDQLFEGQGPFATNDPRGFVGAATRLRFDCGGRAPCGAGLAPVTGGEQLTVTDAAGMASSVVLRGVTAARFNYEGSRSAGDVWPPTSSVATGALQPQTLRAITVLGAGPGGEAPVTRVRIWAEQPSDCAFDIIGQVCRKTAAPASTAP